MKHLNWEESKITYQVIGSGPMVMLVHGFAETSEVWKKQVEVLQNQYTFILPDLPGCGSSGPVLKPVILADYAFLLEEIINTEMPDAILPFTLIGHSMGGYIALEYARQFGHNLNGLGLFHSTSYPDSTEKKTTRQGSIDFIRSNGSSAWLKASIPNLFSDHTRNFFPGLVSDLIETGNSCEENSLIQYQEAMINRNDTSEVLKGIRVPVLFIQGESDKAIPMESGPRQVTFPAICYFHLLKQSGHLGMWEEADKSTGILSEYLNEVSLKKPSAQY